MSIFDTIKLAANAGKIVNEIKNVYEENSEIGNKIQEIIQDLIDILQKIKELVPQVDKAVEAIIAIVKKWFK